MDASDMDLVIVVILGVDSRGHPTLSTIGCSFDVHHLDIDIHGGARWAMKILYE